MGGFRIVHGMMMIGDHWITTNTFLRNHRVKASNVIGKAYDRIRLSTSLIVGKELDGELICGLRFACRYYWVLEM